MYTGLATAIGAGAGVGAAYLTKPYLKDDAPSDSFVKQVEDDAISKMNDADKKAVEDLAKKIEEQTNQMENMNIKSIAIKDSLLDVDEAKVKELKDTSKLSQFIKDNFGLDVEAKDLDTKDMEKVDDLKAILEKHVDEAKFNEVGKGELISDVLKANSADIKDPEKIAKALKDKGFDVEASALEDIPVFEEIPVIEATPVVEEESVIEEEPAAEEAPSEESAPEEVPSEEPAAEEPTEEPEEELAEEKRIAEQEFGCWG